MVRSCYNLTTWSKFYEKIVKISFSISGIKLGFQTWNKIQKTWNILFFFPSFSLLTFSFFFLFFLLSPHLTISPDQLISSSDLRRLRSVPIASSSGQPPLAAPRPRRMLGSFSQCEPPPETRTRSMNGALAQLLVVSPPRHQLPGTSLGASWCSLGQTAAGLCVRGETPTR